MYQGESGAAPRCGNPSQEQSGPMPGVDEVDWNDWFTLCFLTL